MDSLAQIASQFGVNASDEAEVRRFYLKTIHTLSDEEYAQLLNLLLESSKSQLSEEVRSHRVDDNWGVIDLGGDTIERQAPETLSFLDRMLKWKRKFLGR